MALIPVYEASKKGLRPTTLGDLLGKLLGEFFGVFVPKHSVPAADTLSLDEELWAFIQARAKRAGTKLPPELSTKEKALARMVTGSGRKWSDMTPDEKRKYLDAEKDMAGMHGDLVIRHGPDGKVIITHEPNVHGDYMPVSDLEGILAGPFEDLEEGGYMWGATSDELGTPEEFDMYAQELGDSHRKELLFDEMALDAFNEDE